jgi:ATP-dependent protease Clp ATPase subunit
VAGLIAGPIVHICNECVDLCKEILTEELSEDTQRPEPVSPAPAESQVLTDRLGDLTEEQLIPLMVEFHRTHEDAGRILQRAVATLREQSVSWERIGDALGMTGQLARERFSTQR